MGGDNLPPSRTPPSQYGWAGGCMGIVIGAIALPILVVMSAEDYDVVLFVAMLYAVPFGAAIGGVLGAVVGLALLAMDKVRNKSRD